jgi:hypothetical protein
LQGDAVAGGDLLCSEYGAAEEGEDEAARHGSRKNINAPELRVKDG